MSEAIQPVAYQASIPVLQQLLSALSQTIDKTTAHCEAHKIDPQALLQARLFPNMFNLCKQIQVTCDFAKNIPARCTATDPVKFEDTETTFPELQQRIARVMALLEGIDPQSFAGMENRSLTVPLGPERSMSFATANDYLFRFALPNFYFHATTAYDILRHNGVPLAKPDYLGEPV